VLKFREQENLLMDVEKERREALYLLDKNTKFVVLQYAYKLPIIKMFALEGAKESPLNPDKADCKNIYKHEGSVFKVYFYDDLLEN
jgi:hypothetical protein